MIADRLSFSKNNIPHFYLNINCNMDNLLMARQQMNENVDEKNKISINDIIIKALALSLNGVPEANCSWGERDDLHIMVQLILVLQSQLKMDYLLLLLGLQR